MATKPIPPARKSLPQPADPLQQLKDDIVDEHVPISTVLRRATLLAHRLEDKRFLDWATKELNGYKRDDTPPAYRTFKGEHVVLDAERQIKRLPFSLTKTRFITLPLPELASYLGDEHDGPFVVTIDQGTDPIPGLDPGDKFAFSLERSTLVGFVHAVRQHVLDWAIAIPRAALDESKDDAAAVSAEPATVFYSWQYDLPNSTNRGFIEDCLERAIKQLKAEETVAVDPSLDRDTKDVPGSPDIAATILEKIDACGLFVCDVSIINKGAETRLTPNPNVLIELGYAVKTLGWQRVVCVFNEATGDVEDLPFDIRHRRVRCYRLEEKEGKADPRNLLVKLLKTEIQSAFLPVEDNEGTSASADTSEFSLPTLEVLQASFECSEPDDPLYDPTNADEARLDWTLTATLFVRAANRPVNVPKHQCKAIWRKEKSAHDNSGQGLPLTLEFKTGRQTQVTVDDAVISIHGPGKLTLTGYCQSPSRVGTFPHTITVDLTLPVLEAVGESIDLSMEFEQVQSKGGWPLQWTHRSSDG